MGGGRCKGRGGSDLDEERTANSIKSDEIRKKKRFVLKYPNGTYAHGKNYRVGV